jgi:hypothetical protein
MNDKQSMKCLESFMFHRTLGSIFTLAILVLTLVGCATNSADLNYSTYGDKQVDASQIAIANVIEPTNGDNLICSQVDGVGVGDSLQFLKLVGTTHIVGHVSMLPGKHVLYMRYIYPAGAFNNLYTGDFYIWLVAEAGKKYYVHGERIGNHGIVKGRVWITDSDGNPVGGIVGSSDEPHA